MKYKPRPGEDVATSLSNAQALATRHGEPVEMSFGSMCGDALFVVDKDSCLPDLYNAWHALTDDGDIGVIGP